MPSWLRTRFDDTAAGGDHATRERRARGPGHAIAEEEEQLRSAGHPPPMRPAACGGSGGPVSAGCRGPSSAPVLEGGEGAEPLAALQPGKS